MSLINKENQVPDLVPAGHKLSKLPLTKPYVSIQSSNVS